MRRRGQPHRQSACPSSGRACWPSIRSAELPGSGITSPIAGISEPLAPLGGYVTAGTPVARVHDFYRWDEPGIDIVADQDGYVLCRKFRARTEQGDVVMVIAKEVD